MNSVNWQEIRNLLAAIDQSDVVEFSLEVQDFSLSIRKPDRSTAANAPSAPALQPADESTSTVVSSPPIPTEVATPTAPSPASQPTDRWIPVTAPMVGTFYEASAPGEPPFVSPGDRVTVGQAVCIIEAMKLMNELEAEVAGTIAEIVAKNAEPVEFGQVLMYIDPA
nr:acetyl-CoA carboxylase biotin carboxyl carrier protein [Synechococcus sp. PCC 7336]